MSDAALKRIEKAIHNLGEQQTAICERIEALERSLSRERGPSRAEVIRFLDRYRAGEALGEASTAAWAQVSDTACLRGGLRTIAMREGIHARLLEERIKELGGTPEAEVPEKIYQRTMAQAGGTEKADAVKVKEFVARFPDCDAALKPIHDFADRLEDDPETASLLRTIAQDERATLEFLTEACALLNA